MKLYIKPGACSLASHIALREAGLSFETEKVDGARRTDSGADFTAINPKGYVPALTLDDGEVLTEGAAILQYIADSVPAAGLAPANGSRARVRLQEQLNFISSELHKSIGALFAKPEGAAREAILGRIETRLDLVERTLGDGREYLLGGYSVADAYLFTVVNWTNFLGLSLGERPHLKAFMARMAARPAVQAALKAEGLAA